MRAKLDDKETLRITASKLRDNLYRILDEVIETGVPVEVVRKGIVVRIVAGLQARPAEKAQPVRGRLR